ncbi:TetR family transcriptional regulator [Microtetraspora sp. NBRC 13810]|uniref:TetR/AcrR family transcriptional regulator C-terminal domain-containing protein n=1 Tax=Microtetraspora sp. NBRC 13810 TaxID=3030990 RepID=UPI002556EE91|nr:TetR/AcrR family transcriptional regulator C-terminal domain-containing protein [Microtetraspora sp. NBRC 13810]GLW09081.1 TetR family transcriptional regulator [Microtetraspora sp. NBRC 13810]
MVVFAGQGDARRSMSLLWRAAAGAEPGHPGRGPKPGLSVDMIVDAGIAVADADGMAALSMRAVGERLGRTGMALYTYVPGKGELVDLMYDRVLAELPTGYRRGPGWRADLVEWAEDLWAFYLRHPWVLQVSPARPVLGPNEYVLLETLTDILRRTGLPAVTLRRVLGALFNVVRGSAQTVNESRQATAVTGVSDEEWWYARSALLEEVAPDFGDRFPALTWMAGEGAFTQADDDPTPYLEREARESFETGLAVLLDGIETAMARAGVP